MTSHRKKKKFVLNNKSKKWILGSVFASIFILPLILLSINWNGLIVLYASGSSAVFPLMKNLSIAYQKYNDKGKPIDITVESTGSGSGLEKILKGTTTFGNLSYSPSINLVKENEISWLDRKIKTITLGIDGIAIVYKGDFVLDINQSNIIKLYTAFSGGYVSYADLGVANTNILLKPYARAGGANKSGTTESFIENNGFNIDENNPEYIEAYNIIKSGAYGNNVTPTKESQTETWNQIISGGGQVGAITYFSTGFVIQNIKKINELGFKVATYNKNELTVDNIRNGSYNWRRLLNTLVSLNGNYDDIKTWIEWILIENHEQKIEECIQEVYNNAGIIQLTNDQINSMKLNGNFWAYDLQIQPIDSAPSNYYYGARL